MLAVHIATAVLDPFAPIRLVDAVVPFASAYRPLWLGLGAVALDLLRRAGASPACCARAWATAPGAAVHWVAYACWPVAVVHGLGTGSDARTTWLLALTLGCVAAPSCWRSASRLAAAGPGTAALRGGAAAALVAGLLAPGAVAAAGAAGRAAGRGARARRHRCWPRGAPAAPRRARRGRRRRPRATPFSVAVTGTERDGLAADGTARRRPGAAPAARPATALRVRLAGRPARRRRRARCAAAR